MRKATADPVMCCGRRMRRLWLQIMVGSKKRGWKSVGWFCTSCKRFLPD